MMLRLSLEYILLVFLAISGVLQLVAIHGDLFKLLFFKRKGYGYVLAAVLVLPALFLLFTWNYRNATGIIQGAEQAGLFVLSLLLATIFTLVLSSFLNRSGVNPPATQREGLEALREVTYYQALCRRFGRRG
jgi:hypothetical protein